MPVVEVHLVHTGWTGNLSGHSPLECTITHIHSELKWTILTVEVHLPAMAGIVHL
jgi:hypothetical protein